MRWCPFCAEKIQRVAVVCKHCGRDLPPVVEEPKKRWSMRRMVVTWCIVAAVAGAIYAVPSTSGGPAGTTAASACLDAWSAISDFQSGTRDAVSTVGKLESAASTARSAAASNSRYEPIAQWIVGAESEVAAGTPGANAGHLYAECGPGRS